MKGQKGYVIARSVSFEKALPTISLGAWWSRFKRWNQLARQRRQLAMLDDAALKDIGLNRADVMQESERPFWDDPLKR
ncbi:MULTISPECIES: DUF1127 domain-containing protein [unclassified Pseudomonas]|uniref:DUF1127 domain-containing protein n=1 Tax=unclassified Pseudomonas TaxID=196821 RepID=UPI00244AC0A4|nr:MULTISPECIES: DUF1127 domain-containing protein [unclassified Pseudomonas]MDG9923902.1 DUF1127 domain-containing protein [Pseudomonas sp. GD04045]MDH0035111.1 DUF1127 domain-containing protein [Pseudomonas sp. GD04019]